MTPRKKCRSPFAVPGAASGRGPAPHRRQALASTAQPPPQPKPGWSRDSRRPRLVSNDAGNLAVHPRTHMSSRSRGGRRGASATCRITRSTTLVVRAQLRPARRRRQAPARGRRTYGVSASDVGTQVLAHQTLPHLRGPRLVIMVYYRVCCKSVPWDARRQTPSPFLSDVLYAFPAARNGGHFTGSPPFAAPARPGSSPTTGGDYRRRRSAGRRRPPSARAAGASAGGASPCTPAAWWRTTPSRTSTTLNTTPSLATRRR